MVRDVEANAPWQKLRANLLLLLQLLALSALIIALARPFTWSEGVGGSAAIFILDTSASMSASDVLPSRLESAKERARQLVDDLPDTARVTIIEAGREARVWLSSSLDRRQAHLAIDKIRGGSGGSDLAVALELASAIASRQPGADIIVLSDGNAELPQRLLVKGRMQYIPFGLSSENLAISLLTLEKSAGAEELTAFIQVSNYGQKATSCRVTLLADTPEASGRLVNAFDLADIPAGGQKSIVAERLDAATSVVKAILASEGDSLALDNMAQAVRPDTQPVPVTLFTQGNRFIKTALSLLPGIVLTEQIQNQPAAETDTSPLPSLPPEPTLPAAAAGTPASPALTIYDSVIPEALSETGSLLFIAPPQSTEYFTVTGLVEKPAARAVDLSDPLLSQLSLSSLNILDAVQISLPAWATPVVAGDLEDGNVPLIFRGSVAGRRIAVITFDLRHSDLPLQVAFPILWANLVAWLAPGSGSIIPEQVSPGDSFTFSAPEYTPTARLIRPDGSAVQVNAENNRFTITDTTQLGIYELELVEQPGQTRAARFAVNLFSPRESRLKPAASLAGVETESGGGQVGGQAMREWWRPLALLALGLLAGEWAVYQRAALARLRDRLRKALHIAPHSQRTSKKGTA